MKNIIKIDQRDNVAIALHELDQGEIVELYDLRLRIEESIPSGHKFALKKISVGEDVVKYGYSIGKAIQEIELGEHVHCHNLKSNLSKIEKYEYKPDINYYKNENKHLSFKAFKRSSGGYGIRNEIWVIPTVGCVNSTAEKIVREFKSSSDFSNIDGIEVLKHHFGCSQYGKDLETTMKILHNIAIHPNAGGVLILGLGCEFNQVQKIKRMFRSNNIERIRFLVAQEVRDDIKAGIDILKDLYLMAASDRRTEVPISRLRIGLECGGSDSFSGLSANPLLGVFSDFLISQGGTVVLSETPEIFGAETILMNRAINRKVFNKIVKIVKGFKEYLTKYNQPINVNPSPGNIAGGITTLEEKSLGCVQKGGSAPLIDVMDYTGLINKEGFNLLDSPSNDSVCTTALGSCGCHMVLFTTGRGTPLGSFIPTVKISTNTKLAEFKKNWIDFNSGEFLGGVSMDSLLDDFIIFILKVAGGEKVLNERNDFKEIAIWKIGATG